jgi:pimeloyl-ACP methyl ester carboxylesterase
MPYADLHRSPSAHGAGPARVHYRERGPGTGAAPAVLLLHGGWGHDVYPFDAQLAALAPRFRAVAPDRLGYGRSGRLAGLDDGFHLRMAEETFLLMDALGLRQAALWGHSDGSVVAAWMAILRPERVSALVLEAFHFLRAKQASVAFFETGRDAPERFGPGAVQAMEAEHGPAWREVVGHGARAWLRIIEAGRAEGGDLYQGRLGEIRAPTLFLHGERDPRSEPGELEAARRALPAAEVALLPTGHSPHTGGAAAEATRAAVVFLEAALLQGA